MKLLFLLLLIGQSLHASAKSVPPPAVEDSSVSLLQKENGTSSNLQPSAELYPPPSEDHLVPEGEDEGSEIEESGRERRDTGSSSGPEWVKWTGSLPSDAVGYYNSYEDRYDYVCKVGCHSGFYSDSKGSYCHYPYAAKEKTRSSFEILVNVDNFEGLQWKPGSHGSIPDNSVNACSFYYVAKDQYGLGKVSVWHKNFYLPWHGREYEYKEYEVLTYDVDVASQTITNVEYNTDQKKLLSNPPESMSSSSVYNNACRTIKKVATLSKTVTSSRHWEVSGSIKLGSSATIKAGIPGLVSGSTTVSLDLTITASGGGSNSKSQTHSSALTVEVPPNHSCSVEMTGYKFQLDIPFTATLTRKYRNGQTRSRHITGTYRDVDYADVRAVVDRCKPIPNAAPCQKN